ncbi:hypothetical protein QGX11_gp127 [Pseudomonas phage PPSC2]|uniref:Uncharacterized protein n=1 Tax=Pseudomonas phage PPSC2 TaxID=2041350 RepID=A0A2R2YAZ7_9CAUD|nr:hypothetical protein QGX11_gp127 [Pseudomonas phage PPSC2]ATN92890.1 hypothetical protein PPSC2_127 [Pseudomonas phage PPSC2]
MIYYPERDGVDHVNVYSKGRTELGQLLTNFADTPFRHPEHGWFRTVEGFWYWLKTGMQYEQLRNVSGWEAKMLGKKWPSVELEHFDQKIKTALRAKLVQHPNILTMLIDNELPLAHYYVMQGRIKQAGYEWINEYYMQVRDSCVQRNYRP